MHKARMLELFPHQIGGHHIILNHPSRPDLIIKAFSAKEVKFYNDVAHSTSPLQEMISRFHGTMTIEGQGRLRKLSLFA